ncbi:MAG: phosphatase PAP2 family protein [Promethearchaeota archaeon]
MDSKQLSPNAKRLVNLLLLGVFFLLQVYVYGLINGWAHTVFGSHELPLFPSERDIPVVPQWVVIYFPLFYAFLVFTLLYFAFVKYDLFLPVALTLILVELVSFPFFIFFPVVMDRPDASTLPDDFWHGLIKWYYSLDEPYNCFPSLHASLSAALFYTWYKYNKKWGLVVALPIAILVMVSTVFVRQHWIVDEPAGAALGLVLAYFVFKKFGQDFPGE